MKNKKLISMVVAIALVAVIGVGATLAYFTDKDEATNVITMGHVDIELTEPEFDEATDDTKEITNVEPNQEIVKDPTITVAEGSEDAYVRATITYEGLDETQIEELAIEINAGWHFNEEDGYYYYNTKLMAGESAKLFDGFKIPETWGNEVADITFKINVNAEAIQADNFTPATETIDGVEYVTGWYYSNGDAITAETYEAKTAETLEVPAE